MRRTLGVLALAILLLVSLLASAPARLLSVILPSGQVFMSGFSGTLWRGKASRCLVETEAGYLHLGAVGWRLAPLSLLLFSPRLTLDSRWGGQTISTGLVLRGSGDVDLDELEATIPADLLRQFVPVSLSGDFSLQVRELILRDRLPVEGSGRLVWQDGGWNAPSGPLPLGTYALDFTQPPGAALVGEVITLAGAVIAEGQVQLEGRSYLVDIVVRGERGLDQRLQQGLSLVAAPVDQGYRIELDGEM